MGILCVICIYDTIGNGCKHRFQTIPVFRVTRPYLNLLMKPRIFFRFSGNKYNLCILKGEKI